MFGWDDLAVAGIELFGHLFGAHKQAQAADRSADIMAASAKYSADLQAKAQADALAFTQASAENAFLNSEAARQGNYGWQAARDRRLGTIGDEVGLGPRETPAYVPGVDPHFGGTPRAGAQSPATMPTNAPAQWTADYIRQQLKETGQDPSDQNVAYWLGKQAELRDREAEIKQPGYALWRLRDPNSGKSGAAMPAAAATRAAAPMAAATPFMNVVQPVVPQSFGYYA
jgi:hypothetical protein